MKEKFVFFIFLVFLNFKANAQSTLKRSLSDIENIVLNLIPNLRLTQNTPVGSLIATVTVSTFSNLNYSEIEIIDEDPFFYLESEKLYLKRPFFKNQQFAFVTILAKDLFNPEIDFTKYFLIPIENEEYFKIFFGDSSVLAPNISIKFGLANQTIIAQLVPLDINQQQDYEYFKTETNIYLDITKDGKIFLIQNLGNKFLKYTNPYLILMVDIKHKSDVVKKTEIWFKIDTSNQQIPALRYNFDALNDQVDETNFNGTFKIRIGQFELDRNSFPSDRYALRTVDQNLTLDDEGNLFIPNQILSQLNSTSSIEINIFDSEKNNVVLTEIFEIIIPTRFKENILTSTVSSSTARFNQESMLECNSDKDCNINESSSNVCLILTNLKNEKQLSPFDLESFFRKLQFVSNKDMTLLLKYYRLIHGLKSNSNQFIDELNKLKMTKQDFNSIGICLCGSQFRGYKCLTSVANSKPHQCHPESLIPSCNANTSKCQKSSFKLTNAIRKPLNQLNNYQSHTCQCERESIIGINCELSIQQCTILSPQTTQINKCKIENEFCYPLFNNTITDHICLNKNGALFKSSVSYLTFDEIGLNNPQLSLNINDPSVLTGIQSFIRDNVFLHLTFDNYNIMPKGPLAILNPSINLPDIFNSLRNRINRFTSDLPLSTQENLMRSRIDKILSQTISSLISQGKLDPNPDLELINNLYSNLNIRPSRNSFFSNSNWNLFQNSPGLKQLDKVSLEKLIKNGEEINSFLDLNRALTLASSENPYLDLFNFNEKPYNLVKLDILPGIYLDADGQLSIRPTPGIFIKSEYFIDPIIKSQEFIFIPGIFNPASSQNCKVNSIFTPGIFAHQIDNFDLDLLQTDANKYLNKFIPMQIPFNINSMLTPYRTSLSETVLRLIGSGRPENFDSYILWTPLDFNPDSSFDLINKNDKFMNKLFSVGSLNQVVSEQTDLSSENLLSTLLLSNPSKISQFYAKNFSLKCITNDSNLFKENRAQGIQFYNVTNPTDNVSVMQFILYDQNGQPIPQREVYAALNAYCNSYKNVLSEFHLRICAAMNQTNKILDAGLSNPNLCTDCSFDLLANEFYNQTKEPEIIKQSHSRIPIWLLFLLLSLFAFFWLLWLLLLCCCCLKWCPLFGICWKKKKLMGLAKPAGVITTRNSFKYFQDNKALSGTKTASEDLTKKEEIPSDSKDLSEDSKKSNLLFTTKRIPEPVKSLTDLTRIGSQEFSKSVSIPNLGHEIRAISNKGFISNFGNQHLNNTENLLELKRISNHVTPNSELSFKLANDGDYFGVDRKKKSKSITKKLPFNLFCETDSNTCFETTSSECETSRSYTLPSKINCCNCTTGICPETMVCELCCCYRNPIEGIDNYGYTKNHDSEYFIVRNKNFGSDSYGKIIDVVNLKSYTSSESEIQPNNFEILFKNQGSSSDVNEYSEICFEPNSGSDYSYKPNVHRMFKNNKIVVLPNAKDDENYYVNDSD